MADLQKHYPNCSRLHGAQHAEELPREPPLSSTAPPPPKQSPLFTQMGSDFSDLYQPMSAQPPSARDIRTDKAPLADKISDLSGKAQSECESAPGWEAEPQSPS